MGDNFSGKLDETRMCKKDNFIKVVHYSIISLTGVRGSFLKTDAKERDRAETGGTFY